jgi:hypothetical protein
MEIYWDLEETKIPIRKNGKELKSSNECPVLPTLLSTDQALSNSDFYASFPNLTTSWNPMRNV